MEKYTKTIETIVKDLDKIKEVTGELTEFEKAQKETLETKAKLEERIANLKTSQKKEAKEELKELEKQQEKLNETLKDLGISTREKSKFGEDLASYISNGIKKGVDDLIDGLSNVFSDAWEEGKEILSFSLLSNQKTRDLAMTYGFSSSQAYGYSQAMEMLGFGSLEDLMYANPQEQEQFQRLMTKYTEQYSKLYDEGFFEEMLKYQIEMREFEQDLKLDLVNFLIDNKDLIKAGMEGILQLTQIALSIAGFLTGDSARIASTSDIVKSYQTSNKTNNIQIDNNFNMDKTNNWVTESGTQITAYLINALK